MVNSVPRNRETDQSTSLTGEKLIDGKVIGDKFSTNVFPILFGTNRYPRFARRIIEASSSASMVARWRCVVVLQPSSAMTSLGEHNYNSRVT